MEWISVKDRLPEKYKKVLVYSNNYGIKEDSYEFTSKEGDVWFHGNREEYDDSVTHWQILPEPPK